ncbi:MAG: hypothetical protein QG609_6 [Patescibacteria group bacterium]|nr:hypothetical protein [Patescibacteria group bacterium]
MEKIPSLNPISSELKNLFDADQADRMALHEDLDNQELMQKMVENDSHRLQRAGEIYEQYKSGSLSLTNGELVQLAFLFQHSRDTEDYWKAHELGESAGEEGKWIAAAAEDRWLLSKGEKQKWGTQFLYGTEQAPMLSDEESGVTDEMRKERKIPPRAEQMKVYQGDIE